ncbi:MAG: hypothetical protein WC759_00140 [Candidatus Micrarchaeia archaeon]|jgi:hypothetical protein
MSVKKNMALLAFALLAGLMGTASAEGWDTVIYSHPELLGSAGTSLQNAVVTASQLESVLRVGRTMEIEGTDAMSNPIGTIQWTWSFPMWASTEPTSTDLSRYLWIHDGEVQVHTSGAWTTVQVGQAS